MGKNKLLEFQVVFFDTKQMHTSCLFVKSIDKEEAIRIFKSWAENNRIDYNEKTVVAELSPKSFLLNSDKHQKYLYTNACYRAEKGIKKSEEHAKKKAEKHKKNEKWMIKKAIKDAEKEAEKKLSTAQEQLYAKACKEALKASVQ